MLLRLFAEKSCRGYRGRLTDQISRQENSSADGLRLVEGSQQRRCGFQNRPEQGQRFQLVGGFGVGAVLIELITGQKRAFDQCGRGYVRVSLGRKKNCNFFGAVGGSFLTSTCADLAP